LCAHAAYELYGRGTAHIHEKVIVENYFYLRGNRISFTFLHLLEDEEWKARLRFSVKAQVILFKSA
jgi:alanine dehydrogenase